VLAGFLLLLFLLTLPVLNVVADEGQQVAGLATCSLSSSPLAREQILDLFVKAKDFFNQANAQYQTDPAAAHTLYLKAALYFERIVQAGQIRNGKLFYNIGNCYYRVDDLGRAILNYRRAEQLIAQDPNVVQNLDFARKKRIDNVEPSTQSRILNILFFWHYDIPPLARLIIFSVCFVMLWLLAGIRLIFSRSGLNRSSGLKWGMFMAGLVSILMFGSLLVQLVDTAQHQPGVVLSAEVVARKGNSETYQPSFQEPLHAGTEFELLEARGDWLQVRLLDGRTCWLAAADVELVN
jgi:tetratricopeptide (TPR) repeat protein